MGLRALLESTITKIAMQGRSVSGEDQPVFGGGEERKFDSGASEMFAMQPVSRVVFALVPNSSQTYRHELH